MENLNSNYYKKVKDTFHARTIKTIESQSKLYHNSCDWLGFQHSLDEQIADATIRYPEKWANIQKQMGHSLFVRNLHYFYGAIELASCGLVDPCHNLLRTVYESILKMYYLALFPSNAEQIQNDMDEKYPKYSHGFLIDKLYTPETKEGCKRFFRILSVKSHSNYSGMGYTVTYSPTQIEDSLQNILTLIFYNILAEIENQNTDPSILEDDFMRKFEPKYKELLSLISDDDNMIANFIPDKPEFSERLLCHLDK